MSQAHIKTQILPRPSAKQPASRNVKVSSAPTDNRGNNEAMNELSEQLKRKLAQLESEMERFKRENAALEKLRLQKKQVYTVQLQIFMV